MWYVLWGMLILVAAWAFIRYRRRSSLARRPPIDTYVCNHCNEQDCACRKEDGLKWEKRK
jgi:hypothetical protein